MKLPTHVASGIASLTVSEELRMAILAVLDQRHKVDRSHAVTDTYLAETLGVELPEIQRQMDILEDDRLTTPANSRDGRRAWISPRGIKTLEQPQGGPILRPDATLKSGLKLFISHSSSDRAIASALVELLRSALALSAADIRCTSVDGYRLPVGADTDDQLRREVLDASGFIGIVSEASISSAYVLFELGARWGAKLHLAPVLVPGAPVSLLRGPLAGLTALRCDEEDQLHQLVTDIGALLGITPQAVGAYRSALLSVLRCESAPSVAQPSNLKVNLPPIRRLQLRPSSASMPTMCMCITLRSAFVGRSYSPERSWTSYTISTF